MPANQLPDTLTNLSCSTVVIVDNLAESGRGTATDNRQCAAPVLNNVLNSGHKLQGLIERDNMHLKATKLMRF